MPPSPAAPATTPQDPRQHRPSAHDGSALPGNRRNGADGSGTADAPPQRAHLPVTVELAASPLTRKDSHATTPVDPRRHPRARAGAPPGGRPMSARTTYSDLTGAATVHLSRALSLAEPAIDADEALARADLLDSIGAHRDVSAALAHLGRVLSRPPAPIDGAAPPRSRRAGPDARTMRSLARRGQPWDWSTEPPAPGTVGRSLWAAARSIRAAADLWATHQTPTGADRSPEASRMRHPAVLGAATREWRTLVRSTGEVADALMRHAFLRGQASPDPGASTGRDDLAPLRDYPRPMVRPAQPGSQAVSVTVARPGVRTHSDPVDRIADGIDRVRHAAWLLAESGTASAPALANLATIGVMVNRAAGDLLDEAVARSRPGDPPGADPELDRIEAAASRARAAAAHWSVVAGLVADLRSPHPPTSALQIERLDLSRLLEDARRTARGPRLHGIAEALGQQAERLSEVAAMNRRATLAAHERGELYVLGRALPQESLARRPDLLEAKLTGRVVPAPAAVLRRLEEAHQALIDATAAPSARDGSSPAA